MTDLGKRSPGKLNFILDLEQTLTRCHLSWVDWFSAFEVMDRWLLKNKLSASLDDIAGYISCVYEYKDQQYPGLDLIQHISLMLDEYGFNRAK